MGCTSSTEYVVDPATGKEKKKTKFGGAHPGNRRPQHQPYVPPASEFGKDGTATAHFVAYGGGNALTLVQKDGTSKPQAGPKPPEYIEVTLPEGVTEGQQIHVQAPDGRLNAVVVPAGFGPGDTFTVEFADTPGAAPQPENKTSSSAPTAAATAVNEPEFHVSSSAAGDAPAKDGDYPSATATPVYSASPQ